MGEKESNGCCEPGPAPCSCNREAGSEPFPVERADNNACCGGAATDIAAFPSTADKTEPCCGPPPAPESHPFEKPGYMLLGGIAQGPDAPWFFKLTGPEETLRGERAAFVAMLESLDVGEK